MSARRVRFGIKTAPQWTTYDDVARVWREADDEPLAEHAWLFDHFLPLGKDPTGPCLEGWTLLAALATQTTRLRLGVMVTGNTDRHPAVLVNMAATVDQIAHGRLDVGLGAGWYELEHTAYGIALPPADERIGRLGEACEVIRQLWTRERTDFAGRYYHLRAARCEPKPVQRPHPPLVIGGHGERITLRVVAQQADIWHTVPETVEEYRRSALPARRTARRSGAIRISSSSRFRSLPISPSRRRPVTSPRHVSREEQRTSSSRFVRRSHRGSCAASQRRSSSRCAAPSPPPMRLPASKAPPT